MDAWVKGKKGEREDGGWADGWVEGCLGGRKQGRGSKKMEGSLKNVGGGIVWWMGGSFAGWIMVDPSETETLCLSTPMHPVMHSLLFTLSSLPSSHHSLPFCLNMASVPSQSLVSSLPIPVYPSLCSFEQESLPLSLLSTPWLPTVLTLRPRSSSSLAAADLSSHRLLLMCVTDQSPSKPF